jgi:hypothetical protein
MRAELLSEIRAYAGRDSVLKLAWQMDQRAVEDDFLTGLLSTLRRDIGFDELDDGVRLVRFLQLMFSAVHLGPPDPSLTARDISLYYVINQVISLYADPAKPIAILWVDQEQARKFTLAMVKIAPAVNPEDVTIVFNDAETNSSDHTRVSVSHVMAEPTLREPFLAMFLGFSVALNRSMEILDEIVRSRQRRSSSLKSLLRRRSGFEE